MRSVESIKHSVRVVPMDAGNESKFPHSYSHEDAKCKTQDHKNNNERAKIEQRYNESHNWIAISSI